MPANNYQFLTEWQVDAPRELIYEILKEGKDYPNWWPDVYLNAGYQPSGRADRTGDRVTFLTNGITSGRWPQATKASATKSSGGEIRLRRARRK